MRLGFKGWKILFASRLAELAEKYPEKRDVIEPLMFKLKNLKSRDLTPFIAELYRLSREIPELSAYIPKPDEVREWLESRNGS
jgi:hypothetical protein